MTQSEAVEVTAERLPDNGVRLHLRELSADLTEQGWVELIASASVPGLTDGSVATARRFHNGRVSVEVQVNRESMGRVMLKPAGGIELPELTAARAKPVLALPWR